MDTICLAHERAILGSWTEAISITVLHDRYRRLYLTLCSVVKYRTYAHEYRILEGQRGRHYRQDSSQPALAFGEGPFIAGNAALCRIVAQHSMSPGNTIRLLPTAG